MLRKIKKKPKHYEVTSIWNVWMGPLTHINVTNLLVYVRKIHVPDFTNSLGFLSHIFIRFISISVFFEQSKLNAKWFLRRQQAIFYFTCILFGYKFRRPNWYIDIKNPLDMWLVRPLSYWCLSFLCDIKNAYTPNW